MERIVKILAYRKRHDLARMLRSSWYKIEEGSSYGSYYYCVLSTVEIYSPMATYEKLMRLSEVDKKAILNAFIEIHPPKAHGIELIDVTFYLDPNAPIPNTAEDLSKLLEIDFHHIQEQIQKSNDRISTGDFEGAITNARTLIENICIYILDKSESQYKQDGDLPKLYKKVAQLLRMEPQSYLVKYFKEILSGCFSIVNGLSEIRNELGDAHGKSKIKYYRPAERHAVFAVNVAKALAEFLYSSYMDKKEVKAVATSDGKK